MKRSLFYPLNALNIPAQLLISRTWLLNLTLIVTVIFSFNFALKAQVVTNFSANLSAGLQFARPIIEETGNQLPGAWTAQNLLYDYAAQKITVTVPGIYTFKTDTTFFNGPQDPMLFLYDSNFDPANPLAHGIVANDDILAGISSGCKQSIIDSVKLPAGNYILVVTGWNDGVSGGVNFSCNGPGLVGTKLIPSLSSIEDTTLGYKAGSSAVITITSSLKIDCNANLTGATVQITGNYSSGKDILNFTNQNGITGTWNSSKGTLVLSGASSAANYQAAIRNITYKDTAQNPCVLPRIISFMTAAGNKNSNILTRTITLITQAHNNEPVNNITSPLKGFTKISGMNTTTAVEEKPVITSFNLNQNYPNPFNPSTTISYSVPKSQFIELKVYNLLGQLVTTLVNKQQNAGNYSVTFNANKLASGVYVYSLTASSEDGSSSFNSVKKMIVMK
jgi:hypothetical protein